MPALSAAQALAVPARRPGRSAAPPVAAVARNDVQTGAAGRPDGAHRLAPDAAADEFVRLIAMVRDDLAALGRRRPGTPPPPRP